MAAFTTSRTIGWGTCCNKLTDGNNHDNRNNNDADTEKKDKHNILLISKKNKNGGARGTCASKICPGMAIWVFSSATSQAFQVLSGPGMRNGVTLSGLDIATPYIIRPDDIQEYII